MSLLPIFALGSQLVVMVADRPPNFDMGRTCKLDLTAATGIDEGPEYKKCVEDEQHARHRVEQQWEVFPAKARVNCASMESIGGTPSYVSLLTCLEMSNSK
jgi:hypothetical protein